MTIHSIFEPDTSKKAERKALMKTFFQTSVFVLIMFGFMFVAWFFFDVWGILASILILNMSIWFSHKVFLDKKERMVWKIGVIFFSCIAFFFLVLLALTE